MKKAVAESNNRANLKFILYVCAKTVTDASTCVNRYKKEE
ncbi:hypothetical protein STW0522RAO56_01870 [Raoultella planticola]|nr:hypothetical protein STW0522RAO56_01870 [Raoultella planticola]